MKKRILSLLLCLCLFASVMTVTASAYAGFNDVKSSDYFAASVEWAVAQNITNGTAANTFSPGLTCTRAQILTFLWRAAGSPESVAFLINPYVDIEESAYYYQAALWAKECSFVDGIYFEPNTPCTRAATVEYFWKYDGMKTVDNVSFSDVASGTQLAQAVSWAVDYGITNGTGGTTFSPKQTCTRGQIVTFLYRYFVSPLDNTTMTETVKVPAAPSDMKLDKLPPEDYTKQPDWYMTLTPADTMSNARLAAEYKQIEKVMDDFRARDIYMSDAIYSRELDLWSQLSRRCEVVKRYDRGIKDGTLSDRSRYEYEELVAKYGDADYLRDTDVY